MYKQYQVQLTRMRSKNSINGLSCRINVQICGGGHTVLGCPPCHRATADRSPRSFASRLLQQGSTHDHFECSSCRRGVYNRGGGGNLIRITCIMNMEREKEEVWGVI